MIQDLEVDDPTTHQRLPCLASLFVWTASIWIVVTDMCCLDTDRFAIVQLLVNGSCSGPVIRNIFQLDFLPYVTYNYCKVLLKDQPPMEL